MYGYEQETNRQDLEERRHSHEHYEGEERRKQSAEKPAGDPPAEQPNRY